MVLASVSLGVLTASFALIAYASREMALEELVVVGHVLASSPAMALGLIFLVALFSGVVEEAAFRGYMQVTLEEAYHPAVAIAVVSLVFALVHPQPLVFLVIFLVGASGWSVLAYLCGSIKPLIIIHAMVDFFLLLWAYFFPIAFGDLLALNILETGLNESTIFFFIVWLISAAGFVTFVVLLARTRKVGIQP